jgi:hypothetical protein
MTQEKWIRKAKNGLNVVFIHGINSSSEECWRHKNGSSWPKLLEDEDKLADIGIYIFSYRTGLNTGSYSLSDIVDSLREHFGLDNLIGSSGIIFVCHSMGGIVARRFLVNQQSDLIARDLKVGLFLVASPSLGSEYANMLNLISSAMGHTQASALKVSQNNVWLNDLDKDFTNLKNGKLQIEGKELIEDLPLYGKGIIRKQIVEPFSGATYFGNSYKVPGSDHITIATPVNREAIQHLLLVQFISGFVDKHRIKITTENLANLVPELAVQQGEGYFVGGRDAVRRTALTLLDSTWDGDLVVRCGDIEACEAELRELESLAICSQEQGDRINRLRGDLALGRSTIAQVTAALRSTFMRAPGRERTWGAHMELEDATIFIESLFAHAGLAARREGDWAQCWVYLPAFKEYRLITQVFIPNTDKQAALSDWCDALSSKQTEWNEVLPLLAFHNKPIARYLLAAIVFKIVPPIMGSVTVDKVKSATELWAKLAELNPPENDRDPLNPFDWCVALNPDITIEDIKWKLSTPPKSIADLENLNRQRESRADS